MREIRTFICTVDDRAEALALRSEYAATLVKLNQVPQKTIELLPIRTATGTAYRLNVVERVTS